MAGYEPVSELHSGYSSKDASATKWEQARQDLEEAELYWLATVRPDGRPHITPLLGVWWDGALYFCTGGEERKAKNLAQNPHCVLMTGRNSLEGLDIVVEGQAAVVSDEGELRTVAGTYELKYGAHLSAPDGTWSGLGDAIRERTVMLFRIMPSKAFGFGKGEQFSQTRWNFERE